MKNPIQPLMKDANGVVRFKGNAIVQHLLDTHPTCDMNRLACMDFTDDDQQQFAQLIGYSLSGYGDLSYVDDRAYATAAEPNRNWCAGCSPDNCSGCGTEPVESEPFGYYENGRFSVITDGGPDKYRERKGYQGAIYTTPQPDRTAELEAALKMAREALMVGQVYCEQAMSGYGFYRPSNPHRFCPDFDSCTPEEIKTLGHAFFDGKTLQYNGVKDIWKDWTSSHCPNFRDGFKWRIKPDEPEKVKLACWLHRNTGNLTYRYAGVEYAEGYVRIPELDREITLPEGEQ